MQRQTITLISVGGTIDKVYGSGKGVRDLSIGPSIAPSVFKRMKLSNVEFKPHELMRKDSLDMTDEDRRLIVNTCWSSSVSSKIIVTHGTDTLPLTAETLRRAGFPGRRTIVFTGALLPACMRESDAEFNLGLALGVCLFAEPGIHVVMNGVWKPGYFAKNELTGVFEEWTGD